jgi:hypothetical protein
VDRATVQTVQSGSWAARLRGISAASALGAPGRASHNPPIVGSSPTRPTVPKFAVLGSRRLCCAPPHQAALAPGCGLGGRPGTARRAFSQQPRIRSACSGALTVRGEAISCGKSAPHVRACGRRRYAPAMTAPARAGGARPRQLFRRTDLFDSAAPRSHVFSKA